MFGAGRIAEAEELMRVQARDAQDSYDQVSVMYMYCSGFVAWPMSLLAVTSSGMSLFIIQSKT